MNTPGIIPPAPYATAYKKEGLWFLLFFALYLLVYGYSALRMGMHVDDLYDFGGEETGLYAANGRWGIALWRSVFGLGAGIWAAGVMSGLLLSALICIQTHLLGFSTAFSKLVYGCFYLGCIQFSHMLQFSFQCDALAAGFLAATGAIWCLKKGGGGYLCLGIVLLAFSFGTYQANCFYFGALFLLTELRTRQNATEGNFCKHCTQFILMGLAAALLWWCGKQIALRLPIVTAEQIRYVADYQSSLSDWPQFLDSPPAGKAATICTILTAGYAGQWVSYTVCIPLVWLGIRFYRSQRKTQATGSVLLMVLLYFTPYLLGLVMMRQQTPWTYISEPLMVAGFWGLLAAESNSLLPLARKALIIFLPFMLLKGMYQTCANARQEARNFNICLAEIRELRSAANAAAIHTGSEARRIILLGEPMKRENVPDSAAESTLTWANMLFYYLRYLKLEHLHIGTSADYARFASPFSTMPTWPATGSVRAIGNEVIIKIGPQP